jgi:hypothetical protein
MGMRAHPALPYHAQVFAETVFEHMLQTHGTEVEAYRHLNVLAHSLQVTLASAPDPALTRKT